MKKFVFIFILLIFLASCKSNTTKENTHIDYSEQVSRLCQTMCNTAKMKGGISSNGPCLINSFDNYPDWACDMVHAPRQTIDNLEQNQCPSYIKGKTHHFVEVDMNCNIIRTH